MSGPSHARSPRGLAAHPEAQRRHSPLPAGQTVAGVAMLGDTSEAGGVLVKFALASGAAEALLLPGVQTAALLDMLGEIGRRGALPPLTDADHESLLERMPAILMSDWNFSPEPARVVARAEPRLENGGVQLDLIMQDASAKSYWAPSKQARFFGEYLSEYINHRRALAGKPL